MSKYQSHGKTVNEMCERHPHIESCHSEYDGYGEEHNYDRPSYWIHLKPGYVCALTETGTIHCKTVAQCREYMQRIEKGVYVNGASLMIRDARNA